MCSAYPRRQLRQRSHREAGREGPWPARVGRIRLGVFWDVSGSSSVKRYPANANGSRAGVAGVTAPDGRVTIMMPHPEHTVRAVQCFWCPPHRGENGPSPRTFRSATGCGTCSIRNRTPESCGHGSKPSRLLPARSRSFLPESDGGRHRPRPPLMSVCSVRGDGMPWAGTCSCTTRDIALENDALPSPAHRIRDGYGGEQSLRVRVQRRAEQGPFVGELDDPSEVHHRDAMADVLHHRQIMCDEQVGQPELVLQVHQEIDHLRLNGDIESRVRGSTAAPPRCRPRSCGD